jgi:hypothetical protein
LSDAVREALALCRRAYHAVAVALDTEKPADAAAEAEADKAQIAVELLRARTAARLPKTWDDVTVLAVIALYWRGELDRIEQDATERGDGNLLIGAAGRALPAVYLAVLEVAGIDINAFTVP